MDLGSGLLGSGAGREEIWRGVVKTMGFVRWSACERDRSGPRAERREAVATPKVGHLWGDRHGVTVLAALDVVDGGLESGENLGVGGVDDLAEGDAGVHHLLGKREQRGRDVVQLKSGPKWSGPKVPSPNSCAQTASYLSPPKAPLSPRIRLLQHLFQPCPPPGLLRRQPPLPLQAADDLEGADERSPISQPDQRHH